ncbi:MAG: Amuc_1099 family pilus-like system protein [Opitutaceae bacterium]
MDWIKKHYDQFLLALAAFALLVVSGLLILKTTSFGENFSEAGTNVVPVEKVPPLDLKAIESAEAQVAQPTTWTAKKGVNRFLFVPESYIIDKGVPTKPGDGYRYEDALTGSGQPNIPNRFFVNNQLPLLDPSAPTQDPDKDGFNNEDEWRGERDAKDPTKWTGLADPPVSTDPNDPKSHPSYVTKLFLKQWIRVPFVLRFDSTDGDPSKPNEMTFGINTISRGRRTQFKKLGETIDGSPYKLQKFEEKKAFNDAIKVEEDVSELTLLNTETNETVALIKAKVTDSPDSYALFTYEWNNMPIQVKKLQEFALQPETDKRYKLVDITEAGALIRLPDGTDYLVVADKRVPKKP